MTNIFFEIPDSLLGSEIMTITRYSKTPAGRNFWRRRNKQTSCSLGKD
jgi:hypothetical protein